MKKEMLINVMQSEECRIAIIEDGVLQELYVERASNESYVNNIYKGKIVNIEPSIQAAFVDFGIGRNGFLHVSDVASVYYKDLQGGGRGDDREDRQRRDDRPRRDDRRREEPRAEYDAPAPRAFEPVEIPSMPVAPVAPPAPITYAEPEPEPQSEEVGFGDDIPMAEVIEEDDFGAGLDIGPDVSKPTAFAPPASHPVEQPASDPAEPLETASEGDAAEAETEVEAKPKKKRTSSTGRGKKKAAEPAEESKPKRRRTRKKEDGDDDGAKPMPSAERRTTEGDDEFYFDPMAPNDRFGGGEEESKGDAPEGDLGFAESDEAVPEAPPVDENFEDGGEYAEAEPLPEPLMQSDEEYIDEFPVQERQERGRGRDDRGGGRGRDDRRGGGGGRGRDDRRGGPGGSRGGPGGGRGADRGRDGGIKPPPIEQIFKRGQEVIVQVIKEGMGTKGPTLSTHISIAGRYLVLAPWLNRVAVSRKIDDDSTRGRLKEIMRELNAPSGIGFIIRTAAVDRNVNELKSDLAYLVRLWEVFTSRTTKRQSPIEVYRESDMITRTIRDMFTSDIETIYIDDPEAFAQAQEFMKIVMPRYADRLKLHESAEPLFHSFKLEEEVHKLQEKKVPLPGGGSIIIEQTEALVAIDVNSGAYRAENNAEETAFQTNLQAAKEIARQLRLRNLGGVIINDFIDMRQESHRRAVEETLRKGLRRDRSRTKILKTSAFGVIEMTRQRVQTSLKKNAYAECGHCRGTGLVKTPESMSIDVIRMIQLAASRKSAKVLDLHVHADVAHYLLNKKRRDILKWEDHAGMSVSITGRIGVSPEFLETRGFDNNGHEVPMHLTFNSPAAIRAPERREERRDDRRDDDRDERDDRGGHRGGGGGHRGGGGGHRGGGGGRR